ncbi:MAG: CDP-alcohol phosphatidyltransferase family protein [Rhodobacterales bacterium]|nr:CDP-alcohol phosphatidyltransferase family protein [Rhodobacterales bacterium]
MFRALPAPDLTPRPARWLARITPRARLGLAALVAAGAVPVVAAELAGPQPAALALALCGHAAGAALALGLMQRGYPHDGLGLCNLVTLARMGLAAALLAPLAAGAAPTWGLLAVAVLALSLDGVDGWLARRERRVSDFGARFDMEVDAALALILALNAWAAGTAGPTVLLLGLPRYVFAAAGLWLPWLGGALPPRLSRKAVCVLQIAVLIALQVPAVAAAGLAPALVAVTAAALAWSFGRDVVWLWRARR